MSGIVPHDRVRLLVQLIELASEAGDVVWDHFTGACDHQLKSDASPVTAADRDGERIILAGLARIASEIPVVAEEEAAAGRVPKVGSIFFLVDPLDGTKEFIKKGTDFTVNIGLIEDNVPTLGVVYAPARDRLYWGDTKAGGAFVASRTPYGQIGVAAPIAVRACQQRPRAVASSSHNTPETEAWLAASDAAERVGIGSSLKFLLVACGEADVYPRPAPTMEWDTAAGDAILRAAGGRVFDLDGEPLRYGKPRFFNPGFVATGPFEPRPLRPFLQAEAAA
jgi:3'(2'), 5'-bisphosphate nucleotidase